MAFVCYVAASALTARRLQRREAAGSLHGVNVAIMVVGFLLHTLALYLRGQHLHRCPVTNIFEVQMFIAWSAVLFYLLIGPSYRVSFLGAFTAPLVAMVVLTVLLAPVDVTAHVPKKHSAWVEFHAAIGIIACGALALASVMGAMYLVQERQLKSRHRSVLLFLLPAVDQLDVIGIRLTILGFVLLTVGMIGGAISNRVVGAWPWPKTLWAMVTWMLYGSLLAARVTGAWRGRKGAVGAIVLFVFMLAAYWGATWLAR
jgi:ABC-type transport system involved in cytochrome c biogenesis permease subunit